MLSSLHPYSIVKEQTNHLFSNGKCLWAIPHLILVEMSGFEPPTPCVQGRCSPAELHPRPGVKMMSLVGLDRVELSTSRLSGVRSNQLSYRPSLYQMAYSFSPWEFRRAIDP